MGVFDDKKFEELDWISQATEPIDSPLNEILGVIPDEINIDYDLFMNMAGDNYSLDLSVDRVILYTLRRAPGHSETRLTWQERDVISRCFTIEMSEDTILDCKAKTLTGEIKVIKITKNLDDRDLEAILGREGIDQLNNMYIPNDGTSRANDILELLGGCDDALKTRSPQRKRSIMIQRMKKLFKENEWKIKDTVLANKVGVWIYDYVMYGNLAAYSNFCRLKVMTHKGQPIYSMEEAK